jgi:hypothetical protein
MNCRWKMMNTTRMGTDDDHRPADTSGMLVVYLPESGSALAGAVSD